MYAVILRLDAVGMLQLTELNLERNKMTKEKVNLENQLEAEQEYILNNCTSRQALLLWSHLCICKLKCLKCCVHQLSTCLY